MYIPSSSCSMMTVIVMFKVKEKNQFLLFKNPIGQDERTTNMHPEAILVFKMLIMIWILNYLVNLLPTGNQENLIFCLQLLKLTLKRFREFKFVRHGRSYSPKCLSNSSMFLK